ncbi:MAG: hypothetical protein HY283_05370 [Nitrospirae bacterium]|nr:hypothetical protein [Nitrospirota bacterium]
MKTEALYPTVYENASLDRLHNHAGGLIIIIAVGEAHAFLESAKIPPDIRTKRLADPGRKQGTRGHVFSQDIPVTAAPEHVPDYAES